MRLPKTQAKKQRKAEKKLEKMAMKIVILYKHKRKIRDDLWHHCSACNEAYCHDFKGQDVYCYDCYYHNCLKEQGLTQVCQACGNVRKFA
jgi:hypothetical protein